MSKNSIPAVRFCDFSDNWESKKIGDLGSVSMNKRIFKDETSETGEVPFYKIGTFGSEPDSFITREKFEEYKSKYPYPEIGDILISASGSIGRTVEYHGEEAYFQDSNIVWLKHDERLNNSFLKQFYSIVKWEGIEGTTIKRLYNKNILETPISFPSPAEQSAIGTLFRTLDDLLAGYKDNLANYQSLKATMLSKMFPKAGQSFPEIRLNGFEGEWEIKKFKSISTKRGKSNNKGYNYPAYSVSNQSGLILQSEQFEGSRLENLEKTSYKIVESNEFAYNPARINVGSIAFNDLDETVIVSSLYVIFSLDKSINNNYALLFIKSPEFNKEVRRNTEGSVREYLFYENFANIRIPIPPTLEEQCAIGSYFSNFDNLINSHQEKISQLEILKKKLLQDMFI